MDRRRIASGSPYEPIVGFSRAVVAGRHVAVAGTAPVVPDGDPPEGAYEQAKRCLQIVEAALAEAGSGLVDVVRTRIYLVDATDWQEVGRAHGEVFGDVRPASTMVVVTALVDPRWRVGIEADAIVG
ncbi:MAG: RidA family protein [Actinomycetota bacterium]